MSGKEQSLSLFMSAHWLGVVTFVFCFAPSGIHRGNPSLVSKVHDGGGAHHRGPGLLPCHWSRQNLHQFKTRHHFLHTAQPPKKRAEEGEAAREISRVGLRMPAYATNMRTKFPIIALILEIITIILFAVFVIYDDGEHGHHDSHDTHNNTDHKLEPMDLYPSKSTWSRMCVETASKKKFRLKAENISDTEILQKTR